MRKKIFRFIFHTNKLISTNFFLDTNNLRRVICGLFRFFWSKVKFLFFMAHIP